MQMAVMALTNQGKFLDYVAPFEMHSSRMMLPRLIVHTASLMCLLSSGATPTHEHTIAFRSVATLET